MRSTSDKKKVQKSETRSENVSFANNEQASVPVFTAVFCFTHAKHNFSALKLYNN